MDAATQKTNAYNSMIFKITLIGLMVISVISFWQFKKLMESTDWVAHTYKVILEAKNSIYLLTLIESKQRASLLYGDKAVLTDYSDQVTALNNSLNDLLILTKDNPSQNQKAKNLTALMKDRLTILGILSAYKNNNQINTDIALAKFNNGQELSEQIRAATNNFIQIETIFLNQRNNNALSYAFYTSSISIVTQVIVLLFLIYAYLLFKKQYRKQLVIENNLQNTQAQLRSIIEGAYDMIAALDVNLNFLTFNKAYKSKFSYLFNVEPKIGANLKTILAHNPEARDKLVSSWEKTLTGDDAINEVQFTVNNEISTFEIASGIMKDTDGAITGAIHVVRDISERIKEQNALEDANKQLSILTSELKEKNVKITNLLEMSDVILVSRSVDELSHIITKYCQRILNNTSGNFYLMKASRDHLELASSWGEPISTTKTFFQDQCWALRLGHIHHSSFDKNDLICEHVNHHNSEAIGYVCVPLRAQNDIYGVLYLEFNITPEHTKFTSNERLIIGTFAELTALALSNVRLRENLRHQSIRDALTGLYNRRYLEEYLTKQIYQSERTKLPIALLMLDLDHFKQVNDVNGHDAGDKVLKEFSHVLQKTTRSGDLAARYGGEEFIVILYNSDERAALKRAEDIRKEVSYMKIKYGASQVVQVTVSIGVACFPEDANNQEKLIEHADKALYLAKKTGRDKVVSYKEVRGEKL